MLKRRRVTALLIFVAAPSAALGQADTPTKREPPAHFVIELLPGYKVQPLRSIDGMRARIFKSDLNIEYYSGMLMSREADSIPRQQVQWRTEQTINGRKLICVYTKSGDFIATFDDAPVTNFQARIRNRRDLAEMLLMVLTYEPSKGYAVDPSAIVPAPKPSG